MGDETSLRDLFSSAERTVGADAVSALLQQQYNYVRGLGISDAELSCIPLSDISDVMELASRNVGLIGIVDRVEDTLDNSPYVAQFLENAEDMDVLLCDISGTPRAEKGVSGFASLEQRVVGIDGSIRSGAESTIAEEFIHIYQEGDLRSPDEYNPADAFLWNIGLEAQAKLSVAVEAVRQKYEDGEYMLTRALGPADHMNIDGRAVHYLSRQVEQSGIEALDDPEILGRSFEMYFESKTFTPDYFEVFEDIYRDGNGTARIDYGEFATTFGTIVGGDATNNFLSGRFDTMAELSELIPGQRLGQWLADQQEINPAHPLATPSEPTIRP